MTGLSLLNNLINGISLGSVYAIIALGYTMVYGIAKMLNFAHGDIIMVGAYVCFFATGQFGLSPIAGVLLAMVVCTILGMVIERLAYKPLRQAPSLAVLITAIGVSYFLQNSALLLWKSDPKVFTSVVPGGSLTLGSVNITYVSLVTVLSCVVIMLVLSFFTGPTKMGKAMRACSEDLCHRLRAGRRRRGAAVLHLSHPDAHHRVPARHQGLHRRGLRRDRLHPRRHAGGHPAGDHRDLCQGL